MTLSSHLLAQMDQNPNLSHFTPAQNFYGQQQGGPSSHQHTRTSTSCNTPYNISNNVHSAFNQTSQQQIYTASDGSQWGAHHGWPLSPWMMMGGPGRTTPWSEEKLASMQVRLQRKLGPEYVTQRPGPGGGPKLSYIEGWKVVNLANEVFGFNGWSSSITSIHINYMDLKEGDRVNVGVTAIVRVTLQDGCYHEDTGFGSADNIKGKGVALEKAQKEAVTDGIKRALKYFGNVLGNCLYDRNYTKEVSKVKVGPAKFDVNDLERRPEFTPQVPLPPTITRPNLPPPPPPSIFNKHPNQSPQQVEAPPSPPLRSIDEDPALKAIIDEESFDDAFNDSFYNEFDESVLAERVDGDIEMLGSKPVTAPRTAAAPPADAPAYQHRQRPDAPASPGKGRVSNPPTPRGHQDDSDRLFQRTHSGPATALAPVADKIKTKIGGSIPPQAANAGSSARAAAIRSAGLNGLTTERINNPDRVESPKIPTGGVNTAAAIATVRIRETDGIDLDHNVENGGKYGGFSSAKNLKRNLGYDRSGSASPTKRTHVLNRTSETRTALSEITPAPDTHDYKRGRF